MRNLRTRRPTYWFGYTILICALVARFASGPTANVSYLLLAGYAIFGNAHAIRALALSWLFSMMNPALVPEASLAAAGRYLVILMAGLSVARRSFQVRTPSINRLSFLTMLFGAFLALHSLMFSSIVDVSLLKSISWVVVLLTLLSAWQNMAADARIALFSQIYRGLIVLLLSSIPLILIPGVGYAVNGSGFQGMMNHPQSFGPTAALAGALVGGRIMGDALPRWRDIALLFALLLLVLLSEARTAGFAMVLGLVGSAFMSPRFAGVSYARMVPGLLSKRIQFVWVGVFLAILVAGPIFFVPITKYLLKRTESTSFLEAADASRGDLVKRMLVNIEQSPFTGIGFGIGSNPTEMVVDRDPVLGLPLSAQVEKGVMPVAVVEELGIFGAIAAFAWFMLVLRKGARSGVRQFAVIITLILVNFGESMFFSVGGMGMLLLILTTGAVTQGAQWKRKARHV
jgi:hypothetical protein